MYACKSGVSVVWKEAEALYSPGLIEARTEWLPTEMRGWVMPDETEEEKEEEEEDEEEEEGDKAGRRAGTFCTGNFSSLNTSWEEEEGDTQQY